MYQLKIISATVRPSRKGPLIAQWIEGIAKNQNLFKVSLIDLGIENLPMMNEPHHPVLKKYVHPHTLNWSAKIEEADAFVFVTGEYDFNYPAPLRNALEYLSLEWQYKAAGIVSYGGVSAGTRAANSLKADLATFKIVPMQEAVYFPFFQNNISEQGVFEANEVSEKAAEVMLKEIYKWTTALKTLRA